MACSTSEERMMLAELDGLGGVSLCGCGTVHLTVGAVTVRLAPEAFLQAVRMCEKAAGQLTVENMMRTMGVGSSVMH